MELDLSTIKDLTTIAKPFVDPILSTLIKPKIDKLTEWLNSRGIEHKVADNYFENKFSNYLTLAFDKFSTMNILIFPNQQIKIEEIYYPLTICSTKDRKSLNLGKVNFKFIEEYGKILISDFAGMGKSTIMKWIGLSLIKSADSIPILIELKKIKNGHEIIDEIFLQFDPIDKSFDRDLIFKFLELGSFTFLLDGFDEVEYKQRGNVISDLKMFISKANSNNFILTSRPDDALASFGNFQKFNIEPLTENDSFDVIRKYDEFSNLKIATKLISDIKVRPTQIKEFLVNPFLVSLLYKTYSYNKNIPSKKSTFYDDVYNALYKQHDLTKDGYDRVKHSQLDISDFRKVLRELAFYTTIKNKIEYSSNLLLNYLKEVKKQCIGLEFKEALYIDDLESTVPVFYKDGPLYRWAHKSLQDYFTAEHISLSPKKELIIERMFKSSKSNYLNIFDFLYELEIELFTKIITLEIVNEFINYYESNCTKFPSISRSQVSLRLAFTFGNSLSVSKHEGNNIMNHFTQLSNPETLNDHESLSIYVLKDPERTIYSVFETSFRQEIINLLGRKQESIFQDMKEDEFNKESYKYIDEKPNRADLEYKKGIYFKNHFKAINSMAVRELKSSDGKNGPYLLDYNKCKKFKASFEKEISKKDMGLFDFI